MGLVPTMGALHAGHAFLLDEARARCDVLVTSIFVNPLQFAAGEDLERYPRTFDAEFESCVRPGGSMCSLPRTSTRSIPGGDPQVTIDPGPGGDILEGASRPGHFRGVLTVVAKLFGLTRPDVAVFGEKDYQQLALLRRLGQRPVYADRGDRCADGPRARWSGNEFAQPLPRPIAAPISTRSEPGTLSQAPILPHTDPTSVVAAAREVLAAEPGVDVAT